MSFPPSQPHQILDRPVCINEKLQASYTVGDEAIYRDSRLHSDIVRKHLTSKLALIFEDIAEELALGFSHYWGTTSDWTRVKVLDSALKIVSRAANRVFVGLPLRAHLNRPRFLELTDGDRGRNEKFLEHSRKYSMPVFLGATVVNMLPSFVRPVADPLIALIGKRHLAIYKALCLPMIEERCKIIQRKIDGPDLR